MANDWSLLVVDGFDDFTSVQLALLQVLAGRVGQMILTLTGTGDGTERPLVHGRFGATREKLEAALGVQAIPIPRLASHQAPALAHLEASLYRTPSIQIMAGPVHTCSSTKSHVELDSRITSCLSNVMGRTIFR